MDDVIPCRVAYIQIVFVGPVELEMDLSDTDFLGIKNSADGKRLTRDEAAALRDILDLWLGERRIHPPNVTACTTAS